MKAKLYIFSLLSVLLFASCSSKKNSDDFINQVSGRYYFNADEVIEVHFENKELLLKWRNQNLTPLKVNDTSFYVRELNEKLLFDIHNNLIKLAEKREHKDAKYVFQKLKEGEKTPSEYLAEDNYEKALEGYKRIKEKDSLNPVIRERALNRLGYKYLRNKEYEKAMNVFNINITLYPKSSNTYDSMGDAYLRKEDTVQAIAYYKKALAINPENRSSKRAIKRLTQKEKE
ncbi:TPR_REGION domain-containing protein [Tenacibaculum sp. 190130A14a]